MTLKAKIIGKKRDKFYFMNIKTFPLEILNEKPRKIETGRKYLQSMYHTRDLCPQYVNNS